MFRCFLHAQCSAQYAVRRAAGLVGGWPAFALEAVDTTVRTPDRHNRYPGCRHGVIPLKAETAALKGQASPKPLLASNPGSTPGRGPGYLPRAAIGDLRSLPTLRTSILLSTAKQPLGPGVPVPCPKMARPLTSVNTALIMAQQGKRVLLVDADLRRPSVHKAFGMPPANGTF